MSTMFHHKKTEPTTPKATKEICCIAAHGLAVSNHTETKIFAEYMIMGGITSIRTNHRTKNIICDPAEA